MWAWFEEYHNTEEGLFYLVLGSLLGLLVATPYLYSSKIGASRLLFFVLHLKYGLERLSISFGGWVIGTVVYHFVAILYGAPLLS